MSVAEVTARIAQIQAQLVQLSPPASTSDADFATALDGSFDTGTAGAASTGTASEDAVVSEARKYLGIPYVWGGTDPQKGLDCSGLVQLVYKNLGYDLPRVSWQQAKAGTEVTGGLSNARPGDILAFGSPVHHVGIYIGGGKMIEAPRPGKDVRVSDVYETPTHIRRVLPADGGTSAARVAGPTPYADLFTAAQQRYGVPATLLSAVARQESGYDPAAVSPAGARGLMQLMPGTARSLGVDPLDPAQAVDGAARMLRDLTRRFGSTELALAAYNAGPGAVLKYDGIPPYPETQRYVRNVMSMMKAA
ncbi:MAG: transglycosylase SLT domain-containing protein [Nocardioidaceae bacterium]|nr:transglycosylase SLT domain-containing protein [Nocardioidaceae bacterium]